MCWYLIKWHQQFTVFKSDPCHEIFSKYNHLPSILIFLSNSIQIYQYRVTCTVIVYSSVAIVVCVSITNCCGNLFRDFYLLNALKINFWPLFVVWTLTWSEDDLATSFLYVVMDSGRKLPLLDQIRHVIVRLNGWIFRVLYDWVRLIDGYKIQERVYLQLNYHWNYTIFKIKILLHSKWIII